MPGPGAYDSFKVQNDLNKSTNFSFNKEMKTWERFKNYSYSLSPANYLIDSKVYTKLSIFPIHKGYGFGTQSRKTKITRWGR